MDTVDNHFKSLWRSSANEAVAYSDDFPEALLVLPELIDGALGDGKASEIEIIINLENINSKIIVRDNGVGITSRIRLLNWASKETASTEHVYGHGSKKCLTKFMPDYEKAKWEIKWRKIDKRGSVGSLNILKSPFKGQDTQHIEDENNETELMNSGTEWIIYFDKDILKLDKKNPAENLMKQLKEIICTRYEKSLYNPFIIKINITHGSTKIVVDSSNWLTLKESLDKEIPKNVARILTNKYKKNNINIQCDVYKIISDGRKFKLADFPLYGVRNMKASRVHIALNGRYIEAMSYNMFKNKEIHNQDNGTIIFINFYGDDPSVLLPTPCTTKVKFQSDCEIFKICINLLRDDISKAETKYYKDLDKYKAEQEESEKQKTKQEKLEKEKLEKQKLEKQKLEKQKLEKEKLEREKLEKQKLAKDVEQPKVEQPKVEQPKVEQPKVEQPKVEQPKVEQLEIEQPKVEQPEIEELNNVIKKLSQEDKNIIINFINKNSLNAFLNKIK
jgi:hypothetical protein